MDPRLCAAIVDRLTFNGAIIQTGTDSCFATNTASEAIAALELRHRQRARAEDRIRAARTTGLRNLPLHDTAQNQIWLEIVQIALDLLTWMPLLALTGQARLWEPRRLRLRFFSTAAQLRAYQSEDGAARLSDDAVRGCRRQRIGHCPVSQPVSGARAPSDVAPVVLQRTGSLEPTGRAAR